jgi:hypothetical protein
MNISSPRAHNLLSLCLSLYLYLSLPRALSASIRGGHMFQVHRLDSRLEIDEKEKERTVRFQQGRCSRTAPTGSHCRSRTRSGGLGSSGSSLAGGTRKPAESRTDTSAKGMINQMNIHFFCLLDQGSDTSAAARFEAPFRSNLKQSEFEIVLQKSIPTQIRQLVLYISSSTG